MVFSSMGIDFGVSSHLNQCYSNCGKRIIIGLRTLGCSWGRKAGGGCIHCTIPFSQIRSDDTKAILTSFIEDYYQYDFSDTPVLCLYTPGSFFDDHELPATIRKEILNIIAENSQLDMLVLESRPGYICEEKIAQLRDILPNIRIEIALGLDSSNSNIRNKILNKGIKIESYYEACRTLNKYDIDILTYVLIKPPYVSEKECIIDGIETSRTAFAYGSKAVSLEPMSVQNDTIIHELYKKGLYSPPWLWSVISIAKQVYHMGEIRIGSFFYPPPIVNASNCDICTDLAWEKIGFFNQSGNIKKIDMVCKCQAVWNSEVEDSAFHAKLRRRRNG